jgi:hypothetical protein
MISEREILKGNKLPKEYEENFSILYLKSNMFRQEYGKPIIVTSGFRTIEDHKRIYELRGISDPPMNSRHLTCEAIDFFDPDNMIKHFIINNIDFMISLGFWIEDISWTPNWVHLQIQPPKSGKRFFIP